MYKSVYLNKVYNDLVKKNKNEAEFIQAVSEFLESIDLIVDDYPEIEKLGIIERIVEPERIISFRVPWVDDQGVVHVNRGYRAQFNSAIGPYKGGLRFDESVNQSIVKFLAFEQIFKNSLTSLPMGGGKGGTDFSAKGKSDGEVMRFCQSFMAELYRHIGENTDVPAGDIGVGAREIGYLFGYYKKLKKEFTGILTGKGLSYGGSLVRPQATGYGVCYFALEMLKNVRGEDFKGKKVIVSGSGNVASYAALKAIELGATVVAMSDSRGMIYDEKGIDVNLVKEIKETRKPISNYKLTYPKVVYSPNPKDIWNYKADMAFPSATQNELDLDDAVKLYNNGVYLVCEGANMPTTIEATKYFLEKGVLFGPGKAANAGGVATSGLEMSQNSLRYNWTFEEVDEKLKKIMIDIYHNCYQTSLKVKHDGNLVIGANIAGFMKVFEAMKAQGIV